MDTKQHLNGFKSAEDGPSSLESTGADAGSVVLAADAFQITRLFLSAAGVRILDVEFFAKNSLKELLVKVFDPEKGINIYPRSLRTVEHLSTVHLSETVRSVAYGLAEKFPGSWIVGFLFSRMSESGYKGEVLSFLTAVRQTNIFLDVLNRAIATNFDRKAVSELVNLVRHKAFMYVYSMVLMKELARNSALGKLMMRTTKKFIRYGRDNNLDMNPLVIVLSEWSRCPTVCKALSSMVFSNALNYFDVMELYTSCNSLNPTPCEDLMRNAQLIDLLIDALFMVSEGQFACLERETIYLLGYVTSAPDERKAVIARIEIIHQIIKKWPNQKKEGRVRNAKKIRRAIRSPVVGACVLRWIEDLVAEPHYYSRCSPVDVIMNLVDMLSMYHAPLRGRILHMLIRLFEGVRKKKQFKTMKKTLFGCLMVLLNNGYNRAKWYIDLCYTRGDVTHPSMEPDMV